MMIAPNSKPTQLVSAIVLGSITACGMYFNARYAIRMGHTLDERIVLGAVSVAFDGAKVLAFCYACHHILRLSILRAVLAGMVWALTASYGMYAAGSYAFGQLAAAHHAQESVNKELNDRTTRIHRLEKDIEDAKLAKNSKGALIWASSGSCLSPTTPESKDFCHAYFLQLGTLNEIRDEASRDKRIVRVASPELAEWSRLTGLSTHHVMVGIALVFSMIMEVVASVSGFAFCKNGRDIRDEIEAEQRKRKHERHMAQVKAAIERNERRNALARQRRAERRTAPALHVVRS